MLKPIFSVNTAKGSEGAVNLHAVALPGRPETGPDQAAANRLVAGADEQFEPIAAVAEQADIEPLHARLADQGQQQRLAGAARLTRETRSQGDPGDLARDGRTDGSLAAGAAAAGEAGADVVEIEHRERREHRTGAKARADVVEAEAVAADRDRALEAGRLVGAGEGQARPAEEQRQDVQPRRDVAERNRPDLRFLQRPQPDGAGRRARGEAAIAEAEPAQGEP